MELTDLHAPTGVDSEKQTCDDKDTLEFLDDPKTQDSKMLQPEV